jgi:hypothetical protein
MLLNEERYWKEFKKFQTNDEIKKSDEESSDEENDDAIPSLDKSNHSISSHSKSLSKKDSPPTSLKDETLTRSEKRKKESDKRSDQKKKSWGVSSEKTEVIPARDDFKSLSRGITEKKKKKPDCRSGGKWHDSEGKFTSKEKAKSWSGGYEDSNRSDCLAGKFKTSGDGRKKITRHSCGRRKDGGKHPYKCKDGTRAYQENLISDTSRPLASYSIDELLDEVLMRMKEGRGMSTHQILALCSKINKASSGEYPNSES